MYHIFTGPISDMLLFGFEICSLQVDWNVLHIMGDGTARQSSFVSTGTARPVTLWGWIQSLSLKAVRVLMQALQSAWEMELALIAINTVMEPLLLMPLTTYQQWRSQSLHLRLLSLQPLPTPLPTLPRIQPLIQLLSRWMIRRLVQQI